MMVLALAARGSASQDEGLPAVRQVAEEQWEINGEHQQIQFDAKQLQLTIRAGQRTWIMEPSKADDLVLRHDGETHRLQLSTATEREVSAYGTGYSQGLKVSLQGYPVQGDPADLQLQLLLTLEGAEEDLVCEILATDGLSRIEELRWPGAFAAESFDHTVVPFMQGMLLPKDWPHPVWLYDTLSYGRGLYMPWWGHQQTSDALLALLETPADAGCHFEHPAGGPTRIGPRWVHSLGRWAYPRRIRFVPVASGDYVSLARRYRRHVIESGNHVSLREKIARNPRVGRLVGTPVIHTSILYHIEPASQYYHKDEPAKNHQLVTFDARASELEQLAARGVRSGYVHLDGWGARGYDNLHPDPLPPCTEAGGWEGMRRLSEVCEKLGFVFAIHDQYRDFYLDSSSYDPRHTLLDAAGQRPSHSIWHGGAQSILCSRLAPGHVRKNHAALLAGGVRLEGAYLDVFAVVPPDECYAPEHPVSRQECLRYRGECLDSVRGWGGVVSSEEPSDWAIRHLDLVHHGPYALRPNPGQGPAMGIPVPLFNLVYHDALLIPWSLGRGAWGIPEEDLGFLHALGNAGLGYLSLHPDDRELGQIQTLCALHRRVGLLALTGHRFQDATLRKQEFTYADGTRVEIDLDEDTFEITPPLE